MPSRISFTFLSTLFLYQSFATKLNNSKMLLKKKIFYDLIQAMQNEQTLDKKNTN